MNLGISPYWKLSQGQVKTEKLSIARLIVDADKGQKVQFLDRNPTNLRRENLVRARGGGLFRARDQISRAHRFHKPELKHVVKTSNEAGSVMN
jgi:hypothetical protein